jgi:hypothetical protein
MKNNLADYLTSKSKSNQPTVQDRQNGLNLVLRNTPDGLMTVDPNNNDGVKAAQAVHAINDARRQPEADWRAELADLERQLAGAWTEQEAKQRAEAVIREHNDGVYRLEDGIKELKKLLKAPHLAVHSGWSGLVRMTGSREEKGIGGQLCGCDGCVLLGKIESAEYALAEAKRQREKAIRLTGSSIKSSKERDKLRPRYKELKQREQEVDAATSKIRAIDGIGGTLGRERINHSERLGYTGLKPL